MSEGEKNFISDARPFSIQPRENPTGVGVLLVHGFTGSPHELRDLGHYLATFGHAVHAILLPGHGTAPEDLLAIEWEHWIECVIEELHALRPLYDRLVVVGMSLGGALSIAAASVVPFDALVTINTPVFYKDWRRIFLPWLEQNWKFHYRQSIPFESDHPLIEYKRRIPYRAMDAFLGALAEARRHLPRFELPMLVLQSRKDPVMDPRNARFLREKIHTRPLEVIYFDTDNHFLSGPGEHQPAVFREVAQFINRIQVQ